MCVSVYYGRSRRDHSAAFAYARVMDETSARATAVSAAAGFAARRRLAPFFAIASAVLVADQATKVAVRGWLAVGQSWPAGDGLLRISHVENSGAAFGILQDAAPFLLVITALGVIAVALYLLFVPAQSRWITTALALILGGAGGNLIDRITRGSVTDFIDPTHYPAFNVADSAIVVGAFAIAALTFLDGGSHEGEPS